MALSRVLQDVVARVISNLGDPEQQAYDSDYLKNFIRQACEEYTAYMRDKRVDELRYRGEITVPANTRLITRTSTPPLPTYLIVPVQCWERPEGSTDEGAWTPLTGPKLLPIVSKGAQVLTRWFWMTDQLQLVPATLDRELRIDYMGEWAPLALPTDELYIPESIQPITYLTMAKVAFSRGDNAGAAGAEQKANDLMHSIASTQIKAKQCAPLRRTRPYPRWGY